MIFDPKQIKKILAAPVRVNNVATGAAASKVVTSDLTTALGTAGDGGVSVPLQVSASLGLGVITTTTANKVQIYDNTTKDKLSDGSGNELYGRITEAAGVYTLSFYSLVAGVETAYTFGTTTNIDFEFSYRFDFYRLPTDALVAIASRNVADDVNTRGGVFKMEVVTVTAQNTLQALSKTPIANTLKLQVRGKTEHCLSGGAVSAIGKTMNWSTVNAGYNLETTDEVIAEYFTLG